MKCCTCKEEKPIESFHKDKSTKTGYSRRCKQCKSKLDTKYRSKNSEKIKELNRKYRSDPKIQEKNRTRAKKWYEENREYAMEYRRNHYINNIEQYNLNRKRWYENNPDFKKTYFRMYIKIRKENDPEFALKLNISTRIRQSIKNVSGSKNTEILCGCSMEYMRKWLEFQFKNDFTWENHGSLWHFDHVLPISSFDLSNPIHMKRCFHWSNLRPLEANENLIKGSKILYDVVNKHMKKALHYELNLRY